MFIRKVLPFFALLAGAVAYVAYRTRAVPTPRRSWKRFSEAHPLDASSCASLQGIYRMEEGEAFFGEAAVLKWTYTVEQNTTRYHLSLFCEKDGLYLICEGRRQAGQVLLFGHWRKAATNGVGTVQLTATNKAGGWRLQGHWGRDSEPPTQPLRLSFTGPLPRKRPFGILAHRGGARNVDFLPVSENTIEIMKMAARLGATGVEIDVRLTKDGVPVIFHDSFLSIHTVQQKLWGGMLHNYTWQELQTVELRKGGRVPSLEQCLHTVLHQTPLETVWLDIKKECDLKEVRRLQQQYMDLAQSIGRRLDIYIGVPDKQIFQCFQQLPDHRQAPSLVELDPSCVHAVDADVWAPQYTGGTQAEEVASMHEAGKKVFVWSLDNKMMIDHYVSEGDFDGIITNTPSVAAFWYYTSDSKTYASAPQAAVAGQG